MKPILKPLDPVRDREQIVANIATIKATMPEMLPIIKSMVARGLIDGWRNVAWVGKSGESPPGIAYQGAPAAPL